MQYPFWHENSSSSHSRGAVGKQNISRRQVNNTMEFYLASRTVCAIQCLYSVFWTMLSSTCGSTKTWSLQACGGVSHQPSDITGNRWEKSSWCREMLINLHQSIINANIYCRILLSYLLPTVVNNARDIPLKFYLLPQKGCIYENFCEWTYGSPAHRNHPHSHCRHHRPTNDEYTCHCRNENPRGSKWEALEWEKEAIY